MFKMFIKCLVKFLERFMQHRIDYKGEIYEIKYPPGVPFAKLPEIVLYIYLLDYYMIYHHLIILICFQNHH